MVAICVRRYMCAERITCSGHETHQKSGKWLAFLTSVHEAHDEEDVWVDVMRFMPLFIEVHVEERR